MFYTLANTTLPLLAWAFLTHPEWDVELFGGQIVIHAWNLFLLATALMPLLSGAAFVFLPESPKFLMSRGRNDEAMAVFRRIYSMNTGRPGEEYPIEKLHSERAGELAGGLAALRGGGAQLAPLFRAPHACWLLLLCGIHVGCMFGSNTLRLWYPQLAAMIGNHVDESLCSAIAPDATPPLPADWEGEGEPCQPIDTDMVTYLQSVIVGSGSILTYGIGGMLVNKCGKKLVTAVCCWVAAALIMTMPVLGAGAFSVVALVTAALAFTSLSGAALSSIPVDLFPTDLRVMALAIYLMTGRMGTILGTVAFPALMDFGCYPPFIAISGVLIVCGAACLLLPNTTLKRME
ncbi:hypothetical protein JYU34_004777 [Plutella xylostella]|uniref:Uncharacterized protein n=1 Tax=Plutella xylostella TaxID=51655 RepID=A0ABQ7QYU5_PLUXY|nr:hypothetical protein JYU34_004777 [Plutella xylostella]